MIALTDTGLAHLMKAAKPLAPKDRRYVALAHLITAGWLTAHDHAYA
jgi:hypothetical protein